MLSQVPTGDFAEAANSNNNITMSQAIQAKPQPQSRQSINPGL
jgi:hypothetical protein